MATPTDTLLEGLTERVRAVQRWLVLLAVLRALAGAAAGFLAFMAIFSLLDHWLHFAPAPRLAALVLLLGGLAAVLYGLVRTLLRGASIHQSARFIEARHTLHQQLVAAVEYHEDRDNYPYSTALADQMVRQVAESSRAIDFTKTVPKWQAYAAVSIILIGALITSVALFSNAVYFKRYFARLTAPLADVPPLPPTALETYTGDLVARPGTSVRLAAHVYGKTPQQALLRVVEPGEGDEERLVKEVYVSPDQGPDGNTDVSAGATFPEGDYRYQFLAGEAASNWHTIAIAAAPEITSIHAEVQPPDADSAYTEEVQEFSLEVMEGSKVTLSLEVTRPVVSVAVTGMTQDDVTLTLDEATAFTYPFAATEEGMLQFGLTGVGGVVNENTPPLQIHLRSDTLPTFELVTPNGDYLATSVASIPIEFAVEDDFGMTAAELVVEVPRAEPIRITAELTPGARATTLAYTLELEDFDLELGDSVLFHAEATEAPTGAKPDGDKSIGDLYFVEVKPYRQIWHQPPPSMPNSDPGKKGLESGERILRLIDLLEHARALLKKTWPLAEKKAFTDQDKSQLQSLNADAAYLQLQTERHLNAAREGLSEAQIDSLADIEAHFSEAGTALFNEDPESAVSHEKEAYQQLRLLVDELEKALQQGSGAPVDEGPERLRMEEQVHLTRYEQEQQTWDMERLVNAFDDVRERQDALKRRFDTFMRDYEKQEAIAQSTTDERAWTESAPYASEAQKPSDSTGGKSNSSRTTLEGALAPIEGASGAAPVGKGRTDTNSASLQERLEMMRVQQAAMKEEAMALAEALAAQRSETNDTGTALDHVEQALDHMDEFDAAAADVFYTGKPEAMERAGEALSDAVRQLDLARFAMELAARLSEQEIAAKRLTEQAKAMGHLAQALERATTAEEQQALSDEMDRLLQQFGEDGGAQYVRPPQHGAGLGIPPGNIALVRSLVAGHEPPDGSFRDLQPARQAEWLAEHFYSLAIAAANQPGELRREEPSNPAFAPLEEEFFKKAAAYEHGGTP